MLWNCRDSILIASGRRPTLLSATAFISWAGPSASFPQLLLPFSPVSPRLRLSLLLGCSLELALQLIIGTHQAHGHPPELVEFARDIASNFPTSSSSIASSSLTSITLFSHINLSKCRHHHPTKPQPTPSNGPPSPRPPPNPSARNLACTLSDKPHSRPALTW